MYSEIFETDDGYEVITWECEADSEDDDGHRAIGRDQYTTLAEAKAALAELQNADLKPNQLYFCRALPLHWIATDAERNAWMFPAQPNGWRDRTPYRGYRAALTPTDASNAIGTGWPGSLAICDHCRLGIGPQMSAEDAGRGEHAATWVDADGDSCGTVHHVCDTCLSAGSPGGPGYRKVSDTGPGATCYGCGQRIPDGVQLGSVYCGRCGEAGR